MKCPTCLENTPDNWQHGNFVVEGSQFYSELPTTLGDGRRFPSFGDHLIFDFMYCGSSACRAVVVRMHHSTVSWVSGLPVPQKDTQSWVVWPKFGTLRPIDPLVPVDYRRDYEEAAAILDLSPRMSAVLSRRILADLLEKYAGQSAYRLSARIDEFIKDKNQPIQIRENMHAVRTAADLGAHTKREKDDQAELVETARDEAEWALSIIDRLFDWFIVAPAKDAAMREAINAKRIAAGQQPIPEIGESR